MDEIKTAQPTLGTWDKLPTEETERKPKVDFELNKPVEVSFIGNEPIEMSGENGAYYIFHVIQSEEEKVIMTSAWTLLRGLKILYPLKDKKVKITKIMDKGKQNYTVIPLE